MVITAFLVLSVAYVMSRLRFRMRKTLMNVALVLGMFPGFMSMIAIYYLLKAMGLTQSLFGLILAYSIFQVYNSTTIVSGNTTVCSTTPDNTPIEAEQIEQLINNAPSVLYETEKAPVEAE
jgi:ABC-type maltose transport system permease subunit